MKVKIFSAIWCPSCIIMRSKYESLKEKNKNIEFEEFDFDEDKEEFEKENIGDTIPVLVLYDENKNEIKRLIGEYSNKKFSKELGGYLNV